MKMIARVLSILVLIFITSFSDIIWYDVFSDPEIKIPYASDNNSLEHWVEIAGEWIKDVINDGRLFSEVIQDMVIYFLGFITLIAVIYIIYAGFRILTSSWEEEVIKKSKSTIMYVIIGILVIWFAWTIANFAIGIGTGGK